MKKENKHHEEKEEERMIRIMEQQNFLLKAVSYLMNKVVSLEKPDKSDVKKNGEAKALFMIPRSKIDNVY